MEEANLSQNIYLIRKALGKTTGGQSFIETFSKRGYRFVSEVQTKPADAEALPSASAPPEISDSPVTPRPARHRFALAAVIALIGVCISGLYFSLPHLRFTRQPQIRSIAVMPLKAIGPEAPMGDFWASVWRT